MYVPPIASVVGIYGSLGGGKTLTAVDVSLSFIRSFSLVVTNIRLKGLTARQAAYYQFIDDISTVDWHSLPRGSDRGSGGRKRVAVVLDELPEILDQYTSGRDYWVQSFLSWLRMTSKRGQYVFIISQDPSFILKPVRLLCAYWVRCEDMAEFRLPFFRLKLPFFRDYISRRVYNRDGKCVNTSVARKSVVGRHFDTAQGLSRFGAGGDEYADVYRRALAVEQFWLRVVSASSLVLIVSVVSFVYFLLALLRA